MKITGLPVLLTLLFTLPSAASLAEDLNYNLYNLSAEAEKVVQNDLMAVTLSASHQTDSASEAADTVNKQMRWALDLLKKKKGLVVNTGHYQTSPIYKSGKIVSWQASQQLHIESQQFDTLTGVLGDLQAKLKLESMQFSPAPQTRKQAEDELIAKALENFKSRAALVAKTMQAGKYDFVNVSINTNNYPPPIYRTARLAKMEMSAAVDPPAVEGGGSTMKVSVSGEIQLRN